MTALQQQHRDAIMKQRENTVHETSLEAVIAASAACAEITKEQMIAFAEWSEEQIHYTTSGKYVLWSGEEVTMAQILDKYFEHLNNQP